MPLCGAVPAAQVSRLSSELDEATKRAAVASFRFGLSSDCSLGLATFASHASRVLSFVHRRDGIDWAAHCDELEARLSGLLAVNSRCRVYGGGGDYFHFPLQVHGCFPVDQPHAVACCDAFRV